MLCFFYGQHSVFINGNDRIDQLFVFFIESRQFGKIKFAVFHKGVEQTSWNIIIHVHAPKKVSVLQDQVAKLILESIGDVAINKVVEFYYYSEDNRYSKLNESYPRFIASDNLVDVAEEDYEDMEEGEGEDEIFTGDIFQNFH